MFIPVQLVEAHSKSAISWFAVGAYYHTVGKHESAQRYFHKATKLDHRFAPAWIGFGNSFAAQDESDQVRADLFRMGHGAGNLASHGCSIPSLMTLCHAMM